MNNDTLILYTYTKNVINYLYKKCSCKYLGYDGRNKINNNIRFEYRIALIFMMIYSVMPFFIIIVLYTVR